jgi:hypothetical protein
LFYFQLKVTDTKKTEITTEIDKISLENNFNGSILLTKQQSFIFKKLLAIQILTKKQF